MNVEEYRRFSWALYLMGALLIVGALSEPLVQIFPPRFGDVAWRFGAAGLLSAAVISFIFALAVLMGAALLGGHRRTLRVLGVVNLVTMVVLVIAAALFTLDFLQVRGSVDPAVRQGLDLIVLRALLIIGAGIPTTLAFGMAGWRAGRPSRRLSKSADVKGGLVYRTEQ